MTASNGNSIVTTTTDFPWQTRGYSMPSWNQMVIYELHVGSFLLDPSTSNGRGDFSTVIGKLDYIADLGINTIQVLPSDQFPGSNSMDYNPADISRLRQITAALMDSRHLSTPPIPAALPCGQIRIGSLLITAEPQAKLSQRSTSGCLGPAATPPYKSQI
jgi:hypothetical protein